MDKKNYNICQVSLKENIPLILENYINFKRIYKNKISFFVICPKNEISEFQKKLNFEEFQIIDEDEIIKFKDFELIYNSLSQNINYKEKFCLRLKWYYQQVLKISFALDFIQKKKENLIIWDADTVILKKILFFKKDISIKYGNFFEFHDSYFKTNKSILNVLPKYYISFLNQFIAISKDECNFFMKNSINSNFKNEDLAFNLSKLILKSIFDTHKNYEGSLFSEYELIGQSNYKFLNNIQKPILFLRFGLNGKLTKSQIFFAKLLGYRHVTYEHCKLDDKSLFMLNRNQSWIRLINIFVKDLINFSLKYVKHTLFYNFYKFK